MSDYTKTTNFTAKDTLPDSDPLKIIKGSYFDTEFDNLATHIATKYDSGNLASEVEAEGLTSNAVLLTPLRLDNVFKDGAGMLSNIHALADPGVDTILGWDESVNDVIGFTLGAGLSHAGTELNVADAMAGAGLVIASSIFAVGAGSGLTVNADDVALTSQSSTTSEPFSLESGVFSTDFNALTNILGSAVAATNEFIIDVGGNKRAVAYQDMGLRVQSAQATQTLAVADMNTIMEFDATATLTIPLNATTALPIGSAVIVVVDHATQVVTVTADTGVTLNSTNHPGGGSAASDTVDAGGSAVLIKTADNEWYLSGDISD